MGQQHRSKYFHEMLLHIEIYKIGDFLMADAWVMHYAEQNLKRLLSMYLQGARGPMEHHFWGHDLAAVVTAVYEATNDSYRHAWIREVVVDYVTYSIDRWNFCRWRN